MIVNITEYVKNTFFDKFDFWKNKVAVLSDSEINF